MWIKNVWKKFVNWLKSIFTGFVNKKVPIDSILMLDKDILKKFDKDNDNKLSIYEIYEVIKELGE